MQLVGTVLLGSVMALALPGQPAAADLDARAGASARTRTVLQAITLAGGARCGSCAGLPFGDLRGTRRTGLPFGGLAPACSPRIGRTTLVRKG